MPGLFIIEKCILNKCKYPGRIIENIFQSFLDHTW